MEKSLANEVSTVQKVKVKQEEDIKNFAEKTMNELLGWYGYNNNNKATTTSKTQYDSQQTIPVNGIKTLSENNDSDDESKSIVEKCGWCGKTILEMSSLVSAGAVFCSENCFSQSRRANFKRSKTCDWCRQIRHTVSYVDVEDGGAQLQFCSENCLIQYKMQIFCRETQAHLELHPHLQSELSSNNSGNLITPDLWLRNCKSPAAPASPQSSSTTSPKSIPSKDNDELLKHIRVQHPHHHHRPTTMATSTSHLEPPLINLEQPSKYRIRNQKRPRKRCPSTITSTTIDTNSNYNDTPQDLRVIRHTPPLPPPLPLSSPPPPQPPLNPSSSVTETIVDKETKVDLNQLDSTPLKNDRLTPPKITTNNYVNALLSNSLPATTVFLPYPIIFPLPIPMPIPIPIPKMFKLNGKDRIELKDKFSQTDNATDNIEHTKHVFNGTETAGEKSNNNNNNRHHHQTAIINRKMLRKRKRTVDTRNNIKHKKTLFKST